MKFKLSFALVFFLSFSFVTAAPPPPSGGGTTTPGCWPPPCVPIDGGISLLMVAGAAYGARRIYKIRKSTARVS